MIGRGELVTLSEDWRFRSPARLVSTDGAPDGAKLLPADIAGPLRRLAADGPAPPDASGLAPGVIRALELDGVLRVTPARPPAPEWITAADDDSPETAALTWGATFTRLTSAELARRLYFFGRRPVTAAWSRRLPDEAAVARWLGPVPADLDGFHRLPRTPESWVWRRWARAGAPRTDDKLYVCCAPAALPDAVRACLPVLADAAVAGFKLGHDLPTVLRPDKFVLFLADAGRADELATRIAGAIGPAPVHPLPFTAATPAGDLVRAATDPPDARTRPAGRERASWRLYICRLAAATLTANRARPRVERVAAALERLTLAGVDVHHWTWSTAP